MLQFTQLVCEELQCARLLTIDLELFLGMTRLGTRAHLLTGSDTIPQPNTRLTLPSFVNACSSAHCKQAWTHQ